MKQQLSLLVFISICVCLYSCTDTKNEEATSSSASDNTKETFSIANLVKENKLQFLTSINYDLDRRLTREIWTVSEDGKTLIVKHEGKYAWGKMIFTRE